LLILDCTNKPNFVFKQFMLMPSLYQSKSIIFRYPQKNFSTRFLTLLLSIFFVGVSWGQVILTNGVPSTTIDFSSNTPTSIGSNPSSAFNGSGFEANPSTTGRLNSNSWAITGWSNGSLAFGGTQTTANTDYTRGLTSAAVITGGIFAFTGSPQSSSNPCLMIQPGNSDWAPGTLTLRIQNNGTTNITDLAISYNLYVRNDQGRSNSFNFSYSSNNSSYTSISALDYTSTAAADVNPSWALVGTAPSRTTTITGLNIGPSEYFYIRWSGADVGGSGSRDEFGLDDIYMNATYAIPCTSGTYTGASGGNWSEGSNWCGGSVPTSASNVTIPSGVTVILDAATTTVANLTIDGTLEVAAGNKLTVSGTLTNSGTLTFENGATLVQTGSNANAGSGGTYNVKQAITGSSSGSAPNGRGWYMGSPVSGATSNLFAPTNSTNLIYHWNANQTTPNWAQHVAGSASTLEIGKGYAVRVGETSSTITFSSSTLNNAPTPIAIPCYKQASTNYQGFNLVSNPFASYLDWNDAWTGTNASNFDNTIYYRVADGSNVMVFDTYNAETGLSTNTSGSFATRYIPPMQAFWVKVASGVSASSNTVNLSLTNSMRDHYTSVTNGWSAGLKSTAQDFPMFLRLNIEQGTFKDQTLVYLNTQASSQFDGFDSEKMFLTGYPQVYTKIGSRKLVFNGLNSNKKITVIPVIVDIPTSGLFTFKAEEFNVEAGLILLEDKQEGITQDITINDTYTFYANAGTISNRFFIRLHQLDPSISAQGPSNNWVESENEINEGGSVVVATNGRGKVTIQQDIDPLASDESDVTIRDASGREVLSGKLSGLETVFQLDVPSGVYFVAVQLNGQVEVKKIFVQQ
jgi:hypothetical protein